MKAPIPTKRPSELARLRAEVASLRSLVIGVAGRDAEGVYRPDTVRRLLRAAQEAPVAEFEDPEQFLALLQQTGE